MSSSGAAVGTGITEPSEVHTKNRVEILALTGLRAVAAIGVVVSHTHVPKSLPEPLSKIAAWGYVGVPLFFMLSGFVLAYNYADLSFAQPRRAVRFYIARIARVMPLYWVMLAYCVAVYAMKNHHQYPKTFVIDLFALQTWGPDLHVAQSHYNGPGWSISAEVFFYAMFPFLAPLVAWLARRFGLKGLAILCLSLFGVLVILWAVFLANGWSSVSAEEALSGHRWLYRNPLPHLVDFIVGMALAHAFALGAKFRPAWASITQAAVVVFALGIAALRPSPSAAWASASWGVLWIIPFGLLILSLASGRGFFARFLATRPLVTLGTASYALYITHRWLVYQVGGNDIVKGSGLDPYFAFFVTLAVLLVVAEGAHRYVEVPCRRWIMRLADRLLPLRPKATPAVSAPRPAEPKVPEPA
ncbi:acyltransferase [Hamadaea sp. NPDC050747]|uniref:acyltransferase family protein n=1 Tax=Hamadaea sp. NPDC050747 TaxID=3155789 RepID=UPI0033F9D4DB